MNKTGNVFLDMILIPVMLVFIGLNILLAVYFWNEIKDNSTIFDTTEEGASRVKDAAQRTVDMYPYIFVMIIISMLVSLGLTGYFIESSPVFLIIGILIIAITIVIAAPLSNAYTSIITEIDLVSSSSRIIELFIVNLPKLVLFLGAVFMLALYSKRSGGYA